MFDSNTQKNHGMDSSTFSSSKELDYWHIQEETKYMPITEM